MATKNVKRITQNSDSKRGTNPKSLSNLQPFKSKEELGGQLDPRINAGGRPHKLSDAYARVLRAKFPKKLMSPEFQEVVTEYTEDESLSITYADKIALTTGLNASKGDTQAAKEIRDATEGTNVKIGVDDAYAEHMSRWVKMITESK